MIFHKTNATIRTINYHDLIFLLMIVLNGMEHAFIELAYLWGRYTRVNGAPTRY